MNYFNNNKLKIFWIAIAILFFAILFNLTSKSLDVEKTSLSVGISDCNTIGGIGMSISSNDDNDAFNFEEKSKIEVVLKKYSSDSYKISNLLDTTLTGMIINVPFINQTIRYPTGCESVSTTSVLQYYGVEISVDEFIDEYLPMAELKVIGYKRNGDKIYSSMHPNKYFIGNPKTHNGLGCYENTIVTAINGIMEDYQLQEYFTVTPHRDLSISDIENYLDNNIPVIVWATQNLLPSQKGLNWYLGDSDKTFQYMKNEHCMVAIGYDSEYIYFNDTLIGRVAYPKGLLETRYIQMGNRAVTIVYNS